MVISQGQLLRAVPEAYAGNIESFVATFNQWADRFSVDTPLRVAHFLAQVFHESGNLRHCEENLNYSAEGLVRTWPSRFSFSQAKVYARHPQKIANKVYANRMGNGDEASGDGWRFRGRGYIGTTGRANYQAYADSEFCVGDLMSKPDLLSKAPGNLKSAMFFWWKNDCNKFADADDSVGLTKRINGGVLGLANRQFLLRRFKRELGINKKY